MTEDNSQDNSPGDSPGATPSEFKGVTGPKRIWNAMFYSFDGLTDGFREEAAFRQELFLAAVMIPFALWAPVGYLGKALMVFSVLLVLIVEILNSAVEAVVDRISAERHPLSKRAKDMGSAAVFICLVNVVAVWGLIFMHWWDGI